MGSLWGLESQRWCFQRNWNVKVPCGFAKLDRVAALTKRGWDEVVVEQDRGEAGRVSYMKKVFGAKLFVFVGHTAAEKCWNRQMGLSADLDRRQYFACLLNREGRA